MNDTLLVQIRGLCKLYPMRRSSLGRGRRWVRALEGVDLDIRSRETLGVVGESGCGKTTLGRAIMRLIEPSAGRVLFEGTDLVPLGRRQLREYRRHMQMVFQSPYSSFNPRFSVLSALSEPLRAHTPLRGQALIGRACELLELVGMPGEILYRYPHEFSGGQLQRIAIARALALHPKFIVLDEPTSALDVSVQAQILNLLQQLQSSLGLTYLFITHDLSVVQQVSDRIAVMYLGKVVELGDAEAIFLGAKHPYTRALLSAAPCVDPEYRQQRILLAGGVPDPSEPPPGCRFHPRCPSAMRVCSLEEPTFCDSGGGHMIACHLAG